MSRRALGYPPVMVSRLLSRVPAHVGGLLLAGATRAVGALRRGERPLHPRGEWWEATLRRTGTRPLTGARWLDEAGEDVVLVRFSTAVGFPGWCPDIQGVALRVPVDGADGQKHADVLWASTGSGGVGRYVLRPARAGRGSPYTTLLPYRGPQGSVLLRLEDHDDRTYELAHSSASGSWRPFATLTLRGMLPVPTEADAVRFDPVLAPPPGLEHHDWVRWLRGPAYVAARR